MTESDMRQFYEFMGSIKTELKNVNEKLDSAAAGRARMHERMDVLHGDVSEMRTHVETLKTDVADTKKVTEDVKRWKQIGMGAIAVIGLGGTAVGATLVSAFEPLAKLLKH